jgi:hypothetical protein
METTYPLTAQPRTGMLLFLSILSLFLGPLTGIPAWVMTNHDLRDVRNGFLPASESRRLRLARGIAIAGTFFFWITLFLAALAVWIIVIVVFVLVMVGGAMISW